MKCLVTGGLGFIGSHLAQRLVELGHEVKVFDLTPSGWLNREKAGGITYYRRSITEHALKNFRCDWVFHLAALADVIPSVENPMPYHRTNVDGTVNVLDHALRLGVKRFIYASSTSIYGIPVQYPTPETAPADPMYPYALTKWVAEEYVSHWTRLYQLPAVSLRITTAYGPGMKSRGVYGSVFKVFLPQKANGAPYTVVGDGSQSRDFIFVDDVVEAFVKAAGSKVTGIFNVGGGQPTTIQRLIELLGPQNGVVHLPKRTGEPDMTWANISKAERVLGWQPKVSIEEGVKIMLEHLDEWESDPVWTPETIEGATREWFRHLRPI
ncbi:MAG: NAD-dependent epimerase/dehydratase family protein [Patescibacteria group bacterium]